MKFILTSCLCLFSVLYTIAQKKAVEIPGSHIDKIMSMVVQQEYELHILLPTGFGKVDKKYPVVYLMDSQWDFPLLKSLYGEQFYDGFIPEIIVVGGYMVRRKT